MSGNNCSSINTSIDVDSKLKQYMLINKQFSKTLSRQRIEIAMLKNSMRVYAADEITLKRECRKWMDKFFTLRDTFIGHVKLSTVELQAHAETINRLSQDAECCSLLEDRIVAAPSSVIRNANESRRSTRSFGSIKNRSQRRLDESSSSMRTIEEDEEGESVADELKGDVDASGIDTSTNNNNLDEDSKENIEEIESINSGETSNEIMIEGSYIQLMRKSLESHAESSDACEEIGEISVEIGEISVESGKSQDENGDSSEESGDSSEESGDSSEESGESDESDKENDETDGENEVSDQESDASHSDVDVESVVDNDDKMQNEESTDAENNSHSVEEISILTANDESTITNHDSNKENETANGSRTTRSMSNNSKSVVSVDIDSDTSSRITPVKSLKKLPANKKKVNVDEQSVNLTYERMQEQSLLSSTPYRSSNVDSGVSVDTAEPAESGISKSSTTNASKTSQISRSISVTSTRPRRKAAPVVLSEPKLNTKLRRPR